MTTNKVILLGNLGVTPELRYTAQNLAVCRLRIATNERRKSANGEVIEQTEWHNVVTFGKTAENCAQYLRKGRQIYVEGRLHTNKWKDQEGKDRYMLEVIGHKVQFLGGKPLVTTESEELDQAPQGKVDLSDFTKPADQLEEAATEMTDLEPASL